MRGWRPFGKESELQVIDDPVYNRMVFDKSDDRHPATAFWTEEGVYLINFKKISRMKNRQSRVSLKFKTRLVNSRRQFLSFLRASISKPMSKLYEIILVEIPQRTSQ